MSNNKDTKAELHLKVHSVAERMIEKYNVPIENYLVDELYKTIIAPMQQELEQLKERNGQLEADFSYERRQRSELDDANEWKNEVVCELLGALKEVMAIAGHHIGVGPQSISLNMPKKDANQLAKYIVDVATGEIPRKDPHKGKNGHAVAIGRLGGLKGGKARAEKLTVERRKEIAKKAAQKRWGKK